MSAIKKAIGSRILASDIHRAFEPSIQELSEAIAAMPPSPPPWYDDPDDVDEAIKYFRERHLNKYGPCRYS